MKSLFNVLCVCVLACVSGACRSTGPEPIAPRAVPASSAPSAAAGTFRLPVMTVCGEGADEKGELRFIAFSYVRGTNAAPFRISLADDEPGGTGAAFSGAAWNATVAAALLLDDPLHGARLTFDMSGGLDGPSAGAAIALAVLAAEKGRPWPADFGITGSVTPDGGVGAVGGVAQKLRAAAAAGLRRFAIPAALRYEDRDEKGEAPPDYTDVFDLGRELSVEVRPVRTLREAWAFAFGANWPAPPPAPESVAALDGETAAVFRRVFLDGETERRKAEQGGKKTKKARSSDAEKPHDALARYAEWGADAAAAYADGAITMAARKSVVAALARALKDVPDKVRAELEKEYPVFARTGRLSAKDRAAFAKALEGDGADGDSEAEMPGLSGGYSPDEGVNSPLAAQLEGEVAILCSGLARAYVRADKAPTAEELAAWAKPEKGQEDEADAHLREALANEIAKRTELLCALKHVEIEPLLRVPVAATLPKKTPRTDPSRVSHFFYSAWKAVWQDLRTDLLTELMEERNATEDAVTEELAAEDEDFAYVRARAASSAADQDLVANPPGSDALPDPVYHACASLVKQAETLALVTALKAVYAKEDAAHTARLARRLREQALQEIAACRAQDVPCPVAQIAFERGEYASGGSSPDMFAVLSGYATAAYTARALRWTF